MSVLAIVIAIAIAIARTEAMASATAIRAVELDPVSAVCKNVLDVFSAAAAVVDDVAISTAIAIAIMTAVAIDDAAVTGLAAIFLVEIAMNVEADAAAVAFAIC